jgi:hypothetical protein
MTEKTIDMFNERDVLLQEAKDQVLEDLRRRAAELGKAGRGAIPGGICGTVWSGKPGDPRPTSLYSEEKMEEIMASAFRIMLLAFEGIEPYEPANGTEGECFMEKFCHRCTKDNFDYETGEGQPCEILGNTMLLDAGDAGYPREWRQDGPEGPRCTAFEPKEANA